MGGQTHGPTGQKRTSDGRASCLGPRCPGNEAWGGRSCPQTVLGQRTPQGNRRTGLAPELVPHARANGGKRESPQGQGLVGAVTVTLSCSPRDEPPAALRPGDEGLRPGPPSAAPRDTLPLQTAAAGQFPRGPRERAVPSRLPRFLLTCGVTPHLPAQLCAACPGPLPPCRSLLLAGRDTSRSRLGWALSSCDLALAFCASPVPSPLPSAASPQGRNTSVRLPTRGSMTSGHWAAVTRAEASACECGALLWGLCKSLEKNKPGRHRCKHRPQRPARPACRRTTSPPGAMGSQQHLTETRRPRYCPVPRHHL